MRDFSWKYFTMTGDVDAYLLYKEMNEGSMEQEDDDFPSYQQEEDTLD